MAWWAAIPAVASMAGGLLGADAASGEKDAQRRAMMERLAQFENIDIPTLQEQELQLQTGQYLGDYAPTLEELVSLGPSAMEGVSVDPRLMDSQMSALETLSEIGEGGMTEGEMAAMRELRRQSAAEAQAKQGQIMQEMAQRGTLGGGMELASKLQAAQSGADRLSSEGDRLTQMAQERALRAISQQGNLAGNIRGQEFGEQADVAQAQDLISKFNVQNQQSLGARNVSAANQAQLRNLGEKQRLEEQRAAIRNYQQEKNKALIQNQFTNQLDLAKEKDPIYKDRARHHGYEARNIADAGAGMGRSVGTAISSIFGGS